MNHHRPISLLFTTTSLLIQLLSYPTSTSYQIGDTIHTLIKTHTSQSIEALRNQMPKFGISTSITLDPATLFQSQDDNDESTISSSSSKNQQQQIRSGMTFFFANGSKTLPWFDLSNSNHVLRHLEITFVYSLGNGGEIHSVSATPSYTPYIDEKEDSSLSQMALVRISYIWEEQADVDLRGSICLMLFAVLVASIAILIQTCVDLTPMKEERGGGEEDTLQRGFEFEEEEDDAGRIGVVARRDRGKKE